MSAFVLSNLVVTAGMLTPGLGVRRPIACSPPRSSLPRSSLPHPPTWHRLANPAPPSSPPPQTAGTIAWQVANQSLNVAINSANANKTSPLPPARLAQSYAVAVGASCSVAVGLRALVPRLGRLPAGVRALLGRLVPFAAVASAGFLNVLLMRGGETRSGIDVFPARDRPDAPAETSLGKSRAAARLAVSETALSRVLNCTPIMVVPPLLLARLQRTDWLRRRPALVLPANLGLILAMSYVALPLALAAFPTRQRVRADALEPEFAGRGGDGDMVVFNRGI